VFGLLIIAAIVYVNVKQIKWWMAEVPRSHGEGTERRIDSPTGAIVAFNFVQVLFLIPISKLMNFEWLQIWLAPKIWLIEYAARMMK